MDNTYNKLQTLCEYIDDTEVRAAATKTLFWQMGPECKGNAARCPDALAAPGHVLIMCGCVRVAQDFINIELDSHRNILLQIELLLTTAMFALAIITVIAGVFGMNLNSKAQNSYSVFLAVSPCHASWSALSRRPPALSGLGGEQQLQGGSCELLVQVTISTCAGAVVIFIAVVAFLWWKKLVVF